MTCPSRLCPTCNEVLEHREPPKGDTMDKCYCVDIERARRLAASLCLNWEMPKCQAHKPAAQGKECLHGCGPYANNRHCCVHGDKAAPAPKCFHENHRNGLPCPDCRERKYPTTTAAKSGEACGCDCHALGARMCEGCQNSLMHKPADDEVERWIRWLADRFQSPNSNRNVIEQEIRAFAKLCRTSRSRGL